METQKSGKESLVVNLFADYILSQIPDSEDTIIRVIDCENFFIIKGKTTYSEVLDIPNVKNEFIKKHEKELSERTPTHTIDLIEYECKADDIKTIISKHKTENQLETEINNGPFIFVSTLPHGLSSN